MAGAEFSADGLADGELFGLNKRGNLSLNLRGVADATGVGVGVGDSSAVVFFRIRLGVGDAAGDSAAEGDAPLSTGGVASVVFLRIRLGVGETAAGDSAAEGDAALSTGGVGSALFCVRCFGGDGDSLGGVPVSSCD